MGALSEARSACLPFFATYGMFAPRRTDVPNMKRTRILSDAAAAVASGQTCFRNPNPYGTVY